MSGAKKASARDSVAMRGPSRQTTARLIAGGVRAGRDRAGEVGEHQAFGAVGDAGQEAAAGRAPAAAAGELPAIAPARVTGLPARAVRAGVKRLELAQHGGVVIRPERLRRRPPRRKARHSAPRSAARNRRGRRRRSLSIYASAKRPTIRSISRTPRRQARNNSLRRRTSSPSLDRSVIVNPVQANAKSPDGPGEAYIEGDDVCQLSLGATSRPVHARAAVMDAGIAASRSTRNDGGIVACARQCSIRCSRRCRPARHRAEAGEAVRSACSAREGEQPRIIDLLFHLPTGFVDRRNQPKLCEVVPDTVVTVAVTIERHRPPPPNRPRAPYNIEAERRHQHADHHLFQRAQGLSGKALARGRASLRLRHRHALRRPSADGASRPRGRRGRLRQAAADRPGLSAHRRAASQPAAQGDRRCARPRAADLPEWQDAAWLKRNRFPSFADALRTRASPGERRTTSTRKARRGRGLPTTNLLAGQLALALLRAPSCARAPAAAAPPRAVCARASSPPCPTR